MTAIQGTLDRPGAQVAYEVSGSGEPAILLGHSLVCDRRMWAGVAPSLATRHHVVNIDARGHGRSTAEGPFSIDDLAQDWLALMDALELERAVLIGLSLGGMTAMRVALAAPERVAGLVLLDTSADRETAFARVKYRAMAEWSRRFGWSRALAPALRKVMFGRTSLASRPDIVERGMQMMSEQNMRSLYHAVRAVIDRESIRDRLDAIRCPSHVVCGAEDAALRPVCSRRVVEKIRHATLTLIPTAGHLAALERPDDVVREIESLCAKIELPRDEVRPTI